MSINKIFPSAQMGVDSPDCRVFYERNVTNLISQLVDKDLFIISYDNNILKFNIKGYYVEYESPSSSPSNIWVSKNISLTQNSELAQNGITIREDTPASGELSNYYQLLINGNINTDLLIKFTAQSYTLPSIIDCGQLST